MYLFDSFFNPLKKLSDELEENLNLIGISKDPEVIHRARVCSRKLRGILLLFTSKGKQLRRLKEIGKVLGPLRDIEVQTDFIKTLTFPLNEKMIILDEKLLLWEKEMLILSNHTPSFNSEEFMRSLKKDFKGKTFTDYSVYHKILKNSSLAVDSLQGTTPGELHKLRISLKKIRYLMEGVNYVSDLLKEDTSFFKEYQDYLGEVHDIDLLFKELASKVSTPYLYNLLWNMKKKRYLSLDKYKDDIYRSIEKVLNSSAKPLNLKTENTTSEISSLIYSTNEKIEAALKLAPLYSQDMSHAKRVMEKSDLIFSALKDISSLSEDHRYLLHMAALLHDIGHSLGSASHHIHSCNIIRGSRYLPLNTIEREVTSIVVRNHRKKPSFKSRFLPPEEMEKIKVLSGILRAADGLEYESYEYACLQHLEVSDTRLIFRGGPISQELLKRFYKKSLYLGKVTGLEIEYIREDI